MVPQRFSGSVYQLISAHVRGCVPCPTQGPFSVSGVAPVYCHVISSLPRGLMPLYSVGTRAWDWTTVEGAGRVSYVGVDGSFPIDATSDWLRILGNTMALLPGSAYRASARFCCDSLCVVCFDV